jgi:hypothetical protein
MRPYLKTPFTKIEQMEWLKVKALSSSPSSTKKKSNLLMYDNSKIKLKHQKNK